MSNVTSDDPIRALQLAQLDSLSATIRARAEGNIRMQRQDFIQKLAVCTIYRNLYRSALRSGDADRRAEYLGKWKAAISRLPSSVGKPLNTEAA